jgi:hypothetical protein
VDVERRRKQLQRAAEKAGWARVAERLDVNRGALWKFCRTSYVPTDPELRRRLGIEPGQELIVIVQVRQRDALGRLIAASNGHRRGNSRHE